MNKECLNQILTSWLLLLLAILTGCGAADDSESTGSAQNALSVPLGVLDYVGADRIRGWACDPDAPSSSIPVHLYFGGPAGVNTYKHMVAISADVPSEEGVNGQCKGGTAHRFDWAVTAEVKKILGPGSFPVHAYGINVAGSDHNAELWQSPLTLTLTDQVPIGVLDSASAEVVRGWACDKDTPNQAIAVHLYFGGKAGSTTIRHMEPITANITSEAGVNSSCGGGTAHRFEYRLPYSVLEKLGPGQHEVFAYGINSGLGSNALLQDCPKVISIQAREPIGWLDQVTPQKILGWACDPDTPNRPAAVHLYFGGPAGTSSIKHIEAIVADKPSEAGVNNACGGGTAHRFEFTVSEDLITKLGTGDFPVHAYGINTGIGFNAILQGSPGTLHVERSSQRVTLYSPYYLRKWPTGPLANMSEGTQWSELLVTNLDAQPASVSVTIYDTLGKLLRTHYFRLGGNATWDSFKNADWRATPMSDLVQQRSLGWFKVEADRRITATSRVYFRKGATADSPVSHVQELPLVTDAESKLRSPMYARNWPSTQGVTQWSAAVIVNPNDAATRVTVKVFKIDGTLLGSFARDVAPRAAWNAHRDSQWDALPIADTAAQGSLGWFEISSTLPVAATNRILFRQGTQANSPVVVWQDEPLVDRASRLLHAPLFLKNWPFSTGKTQWSGLILVNDNDVANKITVRVYKTDGSGLFKSFQRQLAPRQWWGSSGDSDWKSIGNPDTRAVGWVEVSAERPIFGINRKTIRSGGALDSPVVLLDDEPLAQSDLEPKYTTSFFKNWELDEGQAVPSQWSTPIVVNTSDRPTTITVNVRNRNNAITPLATLRKTLKAKSFWNAYGDSEWNAIANTATLSGGPAARGAIEVLPSDQPVIAVNRVTMREGNTFNAEARLLDDVTFATSPEFSFQAAVDLSQMSIFGIHYHPDPDRALPPWLGGGSRKIWVTEYAAWGNLYDTFHVDGKCNWNQTCGLLSKVASDSTQVIARLDYKPIRDGVQTNYSVPQPNESLDPWKAKIKQLFDSKDDTPINRFAPYLLIGNEVNACPENVVNPDRDCNGFATKPTPPEHYAAVYKAMRAAIHSYVTGAYPDVQVMLQASAPGAYGGARYTNYVLESLCDHPVDAIALHAYGSPIESEIGVDGLYGFAGSISAQLRAIDDACGGQFSDVPVVITEFSRGSNVVLDNDFVGRVYAWIADWNTKPSVHKIQGATYFLGRRNGDINQCPIVNASTGERADCLFDRENISLDQCPTWPPQPEHQPCAQNAHAKAREAFEAATKNDWRAPNPGPERPTSKDNECSNTAPHSVRFNETGGYQMSGKIYEFWQNNGGLKIFGMPVGNAHTETNSSGNTVCAQWFERHRIELRSDGGVDLGRVGAERYAEDLLMIGSANAKIPDPHDGNCDYDAITEHSVCGKFREFYQKSGLQNGGSLALFGRPLTQPFTYRGRDGEFLAQYFERARFELHPNSDAANIVQFGLLGNEVYRNLR